MKKRIFLYLSVSFGLLVAYILVNFYTVPPPADLQNSRPIPIEQTVLMEDLTWMEIRDLVNSGHDTVILPTGGIEQNGPFVVTGKHNYIVAEIAKRAAETLKNTLVAPVVKLVPQGSHSPPSGHMHYPGTIGLSTGTFESVIEEIVKSLELHGFKHIVLIADSGGNLASLDKVSAKIQKLGEKNFSAQVHHVTDYYLKDKWSYNFLKELGITQIPDVHSAKRGEVHSDYHYESMLAAIDPNLIRADARLQEDMLTINEVSMVPLSNTIANGKKLIQFRVNILVDAINLISN